MIIWIVKTMSIELSQIEKDKLELFLHRRGVNFSHYEIDKGRLVVYGKKYNPIAEYDYKSVKEIISVK
jgi:hypothetical protein